MVTSSTLKQGIRESVENFLSNGSTGGLEDVVDVLQELLTDYENELGALVGEDHNFDDDACDTIDPLGWPDNEPYYDMSFDEDFDDEN